MAFTTSYMMPEVSQQKGALAFVATHDISFDNNYDRLNAP